MAATSPGPVLVILGELGLGFELDGLFEAEFEELPEGVELLPDGWAPAAELLDELAGAFWLVAGTGTTLWWLL
jgi:hypothetical protein